MNKEEFSGAEKVIPEITNPLGKGWSQPDRRRISVSNSFAKMTKATFILLHEYSLSVPTGVYPGKMWRSRNSKQWFLMWYNENNSISSRIITPTPKIQ